MRIRLGNKTLILNAPKTKLLDTPNRSATGINSRISGTNRHVLLIDYDMVFEDVLKEEIPCLQEEFKLGNVYVLQAGKDSFHCYCLEHFTLYENLKILQRCSCDFAFVVAPRYDKMRSWVLRYTGKGERDAPKYAFTIPSKYEGIRKQSTAHANALRGNFGVPIELLNPDGNTELWTESYLTGNRIKR
jgi:hypothetical protein